MANKQISIVICDDIRQEVDNKHSLLGVYGTTIDFKEFPAKLPKLCVAINAEMPADDVIEKLEATFIIQGENGEGLKASGCMDKEMLPSPGKGSGLRRVAANLMVQMPEIKFPSPGMFIVLVDIGDGPPVRRELEIRLAK